jgi:hypothetical protein
MGVYLRDFEGMPSIGEMPRPSIPETTKAAIKRDYKAGLGSQKELALKYGVSLASAERICSGVVKGSAAPAMEIVHNAIERGQRVTIEGLDLTRYLVDGIKDLMGDMASTEAKSKEGIAGVALKWMQYLAEINPPTMADFVDQLITRPDFDPAEFVRLLKERYDKAG